MGTANGDVISMRIHLNELNTKFDKGMREGDELENLKKIYMEIKELECQLHVMEWEADKRRVYNSIFFGDRYDHIEDDIKMD